MSHGVNISRPLEASWNKNMAAPDRLPSDQIFQGTMRQADLRRKILKHADVEIDEDGPKDHFLVARKTLGPPPLFEQMA
jgi:hypothetical protein